MPPSDESGASGFETTMHVAEAATLPGVPPPSEGELKARVRGQLFGGAPARLGRFAIERELGSGGMGVVYRARDPELGRPIALKVIRRDVVGDEAGRARLRREARALARVAHPNVIAVHEVGEHEGQVFVAMELVDGVTLREWLAAEERSWREIVDVFLGAAAGLAAAHEAGLVHRDFKPDNVLIGADGRPRVLDFGLARPGAVVDDTEGSPTDVAADLDQQITVAGSVAGTPAYMAPEQFLGRATDGRTDQFAFCVAMFEALHGERPFAGSTISQLRAAVVRGTVPKRSAGDAPALLIAAIERGLAPDPDARHPDMGALIEQLRAAIAPRRRSRGWLWAVGGAGIAAAAFAIARPGSDDADTRDEITEPVDDRVASILAGSSLPDVLPEALPDDPAGVTIHRLPNGLTIYVAPRRDQPRIEARIAIRVGARDDPAGARGAAYLLAQVTENGSARLGALATEQEGPPTQELEALLEAGPAATPEAEAQRRERLAELETAVARRFSYDEHRTLLAELGATEDLDVDQITTTIAVDVPSAQLARWLVLEAERVRRPVYRGLIGEVTRQIAVEQGDYYGMDGLGHVLYGDGPFGHEPRGVPTELATLPLAAIRELHERWYVPNNTAIVLVGDVDPETATMLVATSFGDWEPALLPTHPDGTPIATDDNVRVVAAAEPPVAMIWPVPLGDNPGYRVIEDVMRDAAIEKHAGEFTTLATVSWPGAATLFVAGPSDVEPVRRHAEAVLDRVAKQGPTEEELASVRTLDALAHALAFEGDAELADYIVDRYVAGQSWSSAIQLPIDRATPDEIRQAAQEVRARMVTLLRTAPAEPPPPPPLLPAVGAATAPQGRSVFATDLLRTDVTHHEPQFLVEGRHYHYVDGPWGEAIATTCRGGVERVELELKLPSKTALAPCTSVVASVLAGTTELENTRAMETGNVQIRCGAWAATILSVSTPATQLRFWSLDLDRWFETDAQRKQLDKSLRELFPGAQESLAQDVRESSGAYVLVDDILHGRSMGSGVFDFRKTPTVDAVLSDWQAILGTRRAALYCGPDPKEFLAEVKRRAPLATAPEAVAPDQLQPPPGRTLAAIDDPQRTDAHAEIAIPLAGRGNVDEAVIAVVEALIRKQLESELYGRLRPTGAALDVQLRVARSGPHEPDPILYCDLTLGHDAAVPAVALAVRTLLEPSIDAKSLAQAVERVELDLRNTRIEPREVPRRVLQWRRDGASADPRIAVWGGLADLDAEAVGAFLAGLAEAPMVVGVAGDLDAMDFDALEFIAPVKILSAPQ